MNDEHSNKAIYIYVDCIEYFSEKLISVIVSQKLRAQIKKEAEKLYEKGVITPSEKNKFGFKNCINIDQLYEALKVFPAQMAKFQKNKVQAWRARNSHLA